MLKSFSKITSQVLVASIVELFFQFTIARVCVFLGIFLICLSSCKNQNCGGSDIIYTLNAININSNDSISKSIDNKVNFIFYINDEISKRDGIRKCRQKDLVIENENFWLENNFILKCSDDLIYNNDTLKANTNLLNSNILQGKITLSYSKHISSSESSLFISQIRSNNLINKYVKFFISGKINKNETFSDSCSIKIIP